MSSDMDTDAVLRAAAAEIDQLRAELADWKQEARKWERHAKKSRNEATRWKVRADDRLVKLREAGIR
ncbi:MAG: hypothetical protein M3306_17720 [Actinomycetota bacterium]|nr:hypothetical protein [Actinomycetota bacterium]